jgi:hypothetical protein
MKHSLAITIRVLVVALLLELCRARGLRRGHIAVDPKTVELKADDPQQQNNALQVQTKRGSYQEPPVWDASPLHLQQFNGTSRAATHNRRAQFGFDEPNQEFLQDVRLLHLQLNANYDENSSCPRRHLSEAGHNGQCWGLGSTIIYMNMVLKGAMAKEQIVVDDIDNFTCGWFQRDKTQKCDSMFGNCYFPALRNRRPAARRGRGHACFDIKWFIEKWDEDLYAFAHLDWMLAMPRERTSSCMALHIRRGDACHFPTRECVDYDRYEMAVKTIVRRTNNWFDHRLVIMSDGDDVPVIKFQRIFRDVVFQKDIDRKKYKVDHLLNLKSSKGRFSENRILGNATSEVINDLAAAVQCESMVGTFTASLSKVIFSLIMVRTGRVPPFYSLGACLYHATTLMYSHEDKYCQDHWL